MKNKRILYLIVSFATIVLGLFVRVKKTWFPDIVNLFLGDILYAFMMFYIVSFFALKQSAALRAAITLGLCFSIEFLQLYQAGWINGIRQTLPGKLVLGSGFLWSDLLAYTVGCTVAAIIDKFWLSRSKISK